MNPKNPTIIVGHYGSGKTEFAANYAIKLQGKGKKLVVADMDIVNPYFRIRELKGFFENKGIKVISSNHENDYHLDMPALAASLQSCFKLKDQTSIIDVGGDPAGSAVLARYSRLLSDGEYNMWIAVNANRPKTSTAEKAAEYIEEIELASNLKINGIINTAHMLRETTKEDIAKGDLLVRRLSEMTETKVIYTVAEERLIPEIEDMAFAGELFPIEIIMRPRWM